MVTMELTEDIKLFEFEIGLVNYVQSCASTYIISTIIMCFHFLYEMGMED